MTPINGRLEECLVVQGYRLLLRDRYRVPADADPPFSNVP